MTTIKVGNNNYTEWHVGGDTNGFRWVEVTNGSGKTRLTYNLAAANQMIEIREREDGTKLSKLMFTDDLQLTADQIGGGPTATMVYDLNALAPGSNAQLRVDC